MVNPISERKLAENEVLSRMPNEKVAEEFDNLRRVASEDNQTHLFPDTDPSILFLCECSDEKCKERIELTVSKYKDLHQNSSQFMLVPGHNIPTVERIVQSEDNYIIVEKHLNPPKNAKKFNKTNLNFSES